MIARLETNPGAIVERYHDEIALAKAATDEPSRAEWSGMAWQSACVTEGGNRAANIRCMKMGSAEPLPAAAPKMSAQTRTRRSF